MKDFKYILRILLWASLVVLLFSACDDPSDNSAVSGAESEVSEESSEEVSGTEQEVSVSEDKCVYSVSVTDGIGNPVEDVVIYITGSSFEDTKTTNSKGNAKFTADKGEYKINIEVPDNYYCSLHEYILTPEESSVTVSLVNKNGVSGKLQAYSALGEYCEYDYYEVNEGLYCAYVADGEMTYFLFVPTRPGTYEIYAETDVEIEIGFYGSLYLVLQDTLY